MSEQAVDWSVLEYPGVRAVARKAATKVAADYGGSPMVDFDDLLQDAYLDLATRPEVVRQYIDGPDGTGGLYHDLLMNLVDKVKYVASHSARQISIEAARERGDGDTPATVQQRVTVDTSEARGGNYTRELIEQLLPAVWDSSYAYGMQNPTAPDPDMPRSKANPKESCTLYAHIADIKTAWRRAYIPLEEKQALLLRHGMGWREREIGELQGVSQRAASGRLTRGVGRLRDYLNGVEFSE